MHGPKAIGIELSHGQTIEEALIPHFVSIEKLNGLLNTSLGPLLSFMELFNKEMKKDWGFCSFNRDFEKESTLENILMWGHYGDGLRGFVLSFEQEKMFKNIDEAEGPYEIIYQNELPKINVFDVSHEFHLGSKQDVNKKFSAIFRTKPEHWRYEQEIRFVRDNSGLQAFNRDSLKLVTLGDKMPAGNKNTLEQLLNRYPNAKIQTAKLREDRYEIYIQE